MRLFLKAAAIPAANKPPNAPENIAPAKKIPRRFASSLRVYQPEKRKATPTKKGALRIHVRRFDFREIYSCNVLCNPKKKTTSYQPTEALNGSSATTYYSPHHHAKC